MKKIKFILPVIALTVSLAGFNLPSANAAENEYQITDINMLKEEIVKLNHITDETPEKIELRKEIMEDTNPLVLEEYNNILVDDLKDFYSSNDNEEVELATGHELPNSEAEVKVTAVDVEEFNSNISPMQRVKKSTGDHNYTVDHNIKATLYPDSHTVLVTNYKVKSTGLSLNYTSTAGTHAIFPTTITKSSRIIDGSATTVGSDINGLGEYNVTIGGYNGIGLLSFDMTITSTVKWTSKSTGGQNVSQSYKVSGDKSQ